MLSNQHIYAPPKLTRKRVIQRLLREAEENESDQEVEDNEDLNEVLDLNEEKKKKPKMKDKVTAREVIDS